MTQAYPLAWPDGWPRTEASKRRTSSGFRTTFVQARADLVAELGRLGAKNPVISSWLPLRNDGLPRADAARMRIDDPGVAVYFDLRGRPMVMARDTYWNVHDNLRSIGLAVAHLRGLERHGGATMMERAFAGFATIAAPGRRPWRAVLGLRDGVSLEDAEAQYRILAKHHHPDVGGDAVRFGEISAAIRQAREELRA